MGEGRRRQQLASTEQTLRNMHQIGQGVWELHTYHWAALLEAALAGDLPNEDVCHDMQVITDGIAQFQDGKFMCLLCDTRFGATLMPIRFAVLRPSIAAIRATPDHALGVVLLGICSDCDTKPDLPVRMSAYLKQNAITDLRPITLTGSGHA